MRARSAVARCRAASPRRERLDRLLRLIDRIEHAAVGKVRLLRVRPAAERIVDRVQLQLRKLGGQLGRHLVRTRTVEVLRRDLLAFARYTGSSDTPRRACACRACRRPCPPPRPAAPPECSPTAPRSRTCPDRIPSATGTLRFPMRSARRRYRAARSSWSRRARPNRARPRSCRASPTNSFAFCSLPPGLMLRIRPRREIVPARAARGLRIRRDDRHARLGQIVPVLDVLRVALAHEEHDRRRVRRRVVRQALLPVLVDAGPCRRARRCRRRAPASRRRPAGRRAPSAPARPSRRATA